MKYKFVYDTNVLESLYTFLSEDEVKIVLATVVGKHNAIFYGYKPERLIGAIKLLSHSEKFVEQKLFTDIDISLNNSRGGIMYLKDFDVWKVFEQQFLYGYTVNDSNRSTQFIATISLTPHAGVMLNVLNNFDIVYKCKESQQIPRTKGVLLHRLEECVPFRSRLRSGNFTTSTTLEPASYWMDSGMYSHFLKVQEDNPVYARKIALVARSLTDVELEYYTGTKQFREAEAFYYEV